MRILVLNASPRPKGIVSTLAAEFSAEARSLGAEVETIDVRQLIVAPCTGCMRCRSTHSCVLAPDDSLIVLEAMRRDDAVVVAAPTYWGNMPGTLKLLFDRLVYGMMEETSRFPRPLMKGKRAAIITACTTRWPFNRLFRQSSGTVRAVSEILKYSGFALRGTIQRGGTAANPELTDRDRAKAHRLAKRIIK